MSTIIQIKCDRCGKVELPHEFKQGNTSFHYGEVWEYRYLGQEQLPELKEKDLCRECQDELDVFVSAFMGEGKDDR